MSILVKPAVKEHSISNQEVKNATPVPKMLYVRDYTSGYNLKQGTGTKIYFKLKYLDVPIVKHAMDLKLFLNLNLFRKLLIINMIK